ncbi:MAG: PqiC family protein [Alphaproteobacteria bacterium]|nr:PqiC family protein [Alphaproteobacteria bacterium]
MRGGVNALAVATVVAAVAILGACGESPPSRFYTLTSLGDVKAAATPSPETAKLAIGVGPIDLPEYVDRPEVVVRVASNKVDVLDFDKWTGSLGDRVTFVLAENLSILLGTEQIAFSPVRRGVPIDYQVSAEVIRFDRDTDGNVYLVALWSLFGEDGDFLIMTRKTRISKPVTDGPPVADQPPGPDVNATAKAMSEALADWSREIAAEIAKKPRPR